MGVFGRNFVYIQDNAPPHTAHDTAAFLDQHDVEVMDWPARSLDMKSIEHVWDQMAIWIRDMDNPTPPTPTPPPIPTPPPPPPPPPPPHPPPPPPPP